MKKGIAIIALILLYMPNMVGQEREKKEQKKDRQFHPTLSISMDPNSNIKNKAKNLALEFEKPFKSFYLRAETRYVSYPGASYVDLSFAGGVHFSFFHKYDKFYVGIREGGIFRKGKIFNTVGGELGINLRLKRIVLGVRITMDYRTDLKIWNEPSKLVNSNYVKIGWVL